MSSNELSDLSQMVADFTRSHVVDVMGDAWNVASVSAMVHSSSENATLLDWEVIQQCCILHRLQRYWMDVWS